MQCTLLTFNPAEKAFLNSNLKLQPTIELKYGMFSQRCGPYEIYGCTVIQNKTKQQNLKKSLQSLVYSINTSINTSKSSCIFNLSIGCVLNVQKKREKSF